jgi:flagellar basal-body rod modification protein FlgD
MTTSGIGTLDPTSGTAVLSSKRASYGDNPFLRLLTEQLRNQTPLEPVDNESFMNQMASYSTMQEQRDLNTNMLKLLDYQGVLARVQGLSQGSALLGKEVSFANADGTAASGVVESVFVAESGDVRLRLAGGKEIDLREVLGIAQPAAGTTGAPATTPPAGSNGTSGSGNAGGNQAGTNGTTPNGAGSTGTGTTSGATDPATA